MESSLPFQRNRTMGQTVTGRAWAPRSSGKAARDFPVPCLNANIFLNCDNSCRSIGESLNLMARNLSACLGMRIGLIGGELVPARGNWCLHTQSQVLNPSAEPYRGTSPASHWASVPTRVRLAIVGPHARPWKISPSGSSPPPNNASVRDAPDLYKTSV